MYKFKYSWGNRFNKFKKRISDLYEITCLLHKDKIKNINELYTNIEDYYYSLLKMGFVDENNFSNVLDAFSNISIVAFLDKDHEDKYNGISYENSILVSLNPGLYDGLNLDETKRLSTYHELGHLINFRNGSDLEFFQSVTFPLDELNNRYGNLGLDISYSAYVNGFLALDEAVAQEVSEAVFDYRNNLDRRKVYKYVNDTLYPNGFFKSNFREYYELQEVVYKFAKNLSFLNCSSEKDMNKVLDKLSKAMFSREFCKKLWDEFYIDPDKTIDMIMQLVCIGKIKEAKYLCCEDDVDISRLDVSKYFNLFNEIDKKYNNKERKEKQKNYA